MRRLTVLGLLALALVVAYVSIPAAQSGDVYAPKRINKVIELFEQDQPVYYTQVNGGGYEEGVRLAQTWADYITYNMEHSPFNMDALRGFMQGLVDGGPTRSGHRTPTVVAVLPLGGINEQVMWGNYWMVEQVLGSGVHGVLLAHARTPEVVRILVQSAATRTRRRPRASARGSAAAAARASRRASGACRTRSTSGSPTRGR